MSFLLPHFSIKIAFWFTCLLPYAFPHCLSTPGKVPDQKLPRRTGTTQFGSLDMGPISYIRAPWERSHPEHIPWSLRLRATLTVSLLTILCHFDIHLKKNLKNVPLNVLNSHEFIDFLLLLMSLLRVLQLLIQHILAEILLCVRYYSGV